MAFNPTIPLWLLMLATYRIGVRKSVNFPRDAGQDNKRARVWVVRLQYLAALALLAWIAITKPSVDSMFSTIRRSAMRVERDLWSTWWLFVR